LKKSSLYVSADRLEIFGQQDREQVLNRLYLLHAPGLNCNQSGNQSVDSEAFSYAGSTTSPFSVAESDLVAAMANCNDGDQAREVETHMHYW